ncbi:hypothetical protein [Rosistilla oblonga]|uniref:hypothetical protein n=1 Tax=Rosistilla oblonga TaxID=2527990 RepID=UPI003A97A930
MTKTRKPRTEHSAASFCVSELSAEEITRATGKSVSMLRRASDPDDCAVDIKFCDAGMLDAALINAGHEAKFLPALQNIIERETGRVPGHTPAEADDRLVEIMSNLGHVVDELRASRCPKGPGGARRVPMETDRCLSVAHELRTTVAKLVSDLEAEEGNVTNIHSKKEAS